MSKVIHSVGKRKRAIARIALSEGKGKITINAKELSKYFQEERHQKSLLKALEVTENQLNFDCKVKVIGGGISGQAEAIRLGIARAILLVDPEKKGLLKESKLLTRDRRVVESKKYGHKKSRKKGQFSKR